MPRLYEPRERPGFMLYRDFFPALAAMDDAALGRLIKALLAHFQHKNAAIDGVSPEGVMFASLRVKLDADEERYAAVCEANRKNGKAGANVRWGNDRQRLMARGSDRQGGVVVDGENGQHTTTTATTTTTITTNSIDRSNKPYSIPASVDEVLTFALAHDRTEEEAQEFFRLHGNGHDGKGDRISNWRAYFLGWQMPTTYSVNDQLDKLYGKETEV